jgi:diguanylate cyclase (GGDEF)-like protein
VKTGSERLQQAFRNSPLRLDSKYVTLSVSIGGYMSKNGESIDTVLNKADKALYEAKDGGRNRSVILD